MSLLTWIHTNVDKFWDLVEPELAHDAATIAASLRKEFSDELGYFESATYAAVKSAMLPAATAALADFASGNVGGAIAAVVAGAKAALPQVEAIGAHALHDLARVVLGELSQSAPGAQAPAKPQGK